MAGTVLFLGGILNITDPLLHIQIYIWLWFLLIFFSVCAWVAFRYGVWSKYEVLWGLYYAFKAHSNAVFIFSMALKAELYSEAQAKCIFDYASYKYTGFSRGIRGWVEKQLFNYATLFLDDIDPLTAIVYKFGKRNMDVEIAKKMQDYKDWEEAPSVSIGGTDTDILLDADSWTIKKSQQHKAIVNYCEGWNEANPTDQIHSYSKFQKYLLTGKIDPNTEKLRTIKPTVIIPWVRIDAAFPINIEDNEEAGARRQRAEDEMNKDKNIYNQYIPTILVGGVVFALVIIVVRFGAFVFSNTGH